jgi:hypothetical protein
MPRELKPCGTTAAYVRHRRNGETPCQACRDAWAADHRARLDADPRLKAQDRDRTRIRDAAAALLIERHREEFDQLLAEVRRQEREEQWADVFAEFTQEG